MRQTVFDDHKWFSIDDWTMGAYNAWDCRVTALVFPRLLQELQDNQQWTFYQSDYWPLVQAVLTMQQRGLLVDRNEKTRYRKALRKELRETDAEIQAFSNREDFNVNASKQRGELLFDTLGLRPEKITRTGQRSTDQDALIRVLRKLRKKDEHARPVLEALFHRSRLHTIDTRYLDFDVSEDGRVRPTVKAYGTETLRLAYAEPPLQQYPKEARNIIHTEDGRCFVAADYSQLEARILAVLAGDRASLRVFETGEDIHLQNASDLFGHNREQWDEMDPTAATACRDFAKSFLYGTMYGGEAETMKNKLYCPCDKCKDKVAPTLGLGPKKKREAEDRWLGRHPAVTKWRKGLARQVFEDKFHVNPFGYKRYFLQPVGDGLKREAYNFPIQSSAACIVNRAMVKLHSMRYPAPIVLQMHDSLMLEVPEHEVDHWATTLKHTMETPVPELSNAVFPVELSVGKSWGSLETYSV